MTGKFFTTSFGHSIPIIEGFRDGLMPPRDNVDPYGASAVEEAVGYKPPKENDFGIMSDIYQYAMLADWFDTTLGADRPYQHMLDIGGSSGLMGQLFKAAGRVKAVDNIEIMDYRDAVDLDRVRYFLRKIQAGRQELHGEGSADIRLGRLKAGVKNRQVWLQNQINFMQSTFPYFIGENSSFYKLPVDAPLGLDNYILGDFYKLEQKYDFLLSATTMQHFSVAPFLEQAYSVLKPGGVLLVWNAYWYWAMSISRCYGEFPWGVQRLTREDYLRYLAEYQPDQVENAQLSIAKFHKAEKRYTVNDYIAAGKNAGFRYLSHHRLIPPAGVPGKIGAWTLKGDHGANAQRDALRDIHCFRNDVEALDLITQSVFLLFRKE